MRVARKKHLFISLTALLVAGITLHLVPISVVSEPHYSSCLIGGTQESIAHDIDRTYRLARGQKSVFDKDKKLMNGDCFSQGACPASDEFACGIRPSPDSGRVTLKLYVL
jgi:hypothetical protein